MPQEAGCSVIAQASLNGDGHLKNMGLLKADFPSAGRLLLLPTPNSRPTVAHTHKTNEMNLTDTI